MFSKSTDSSPTEIGDHRKCIYEEFSLIWENHFDVIKGMFYEYKCANK